MKSICKIDRNKQIADIFLTEKASYKKIGERFNVSGQRVLQILISTIGYGPLVERRKERKLNFAERRTRKIIEKYESKERRTAISRILDRCILQGDCLVWTGPVNLKTGYGHTHDNGKYKSIHNISFEAFYQRQRRKGFHIDHLCMNKRCVNPAHLEEVTPKENNRRWIEKTGGHKGKRKVTQCCRGHEYTESNTYLTPHGLRSCRICIRLRYLARQERKKIYTGELCRFPKN